MTPDTKDNNRTFYCYFKPIAVLCKVIGVFPIQNVISAQDPKDLRFKWFSWAFLYSLCIFGCNIFMIQWFSGFIFDYKESSQANAFYCFIVAYVIIARSVLCFLFCGRLSKKLPNFMRLLNTFDKKKTPLIVDKKKDGHVISFIIWTIIPIIFGFACFALSFLESSGLVCEIMPPSLSQINMKVASAFFGALSTWQVVPLLLYTYFALKIKYNFDVINRTLRKRGCAEAIFDDEPVKFEDDMDAVIGYLRFMHGLLNKSVYRLGECYGDFMAIDQLCVIVMVVVNVCTFINTTNGAHHETHLLLFTFLNAFVVCVVLLVSDKIKESGSKAVDLLHAIPFSNLNEKCRLEIQTFMIQVAVRPVEISASGYFTIDKRQIPSMLSSIATYLVVSLQFLSESQNETTTSSSIKT